MGRTGISFELEQNDPLPRSAYRHLLICVPCDFRTDH